MSFILDALKKSENERQRQLGPSLADVPMRRRQTERPWWAFAVAALLLVNLGVLAIVLLRNGADADAKPVEAQPPTPGAAPAIPQQATPPPPRAAYPPADANLTPSSSNPAVRSLANEAAADPDDPTMSANPQAAASVPAGPPIVRAIEAPTVTPLPQQRAVAEPAPQASNNEMLPTHNSLVAGGTSLPELRLDIHVYSPQPADRFVFVNMRKYLEGQPLSEGPMVERITNEGVILNQQGLRFLLPRQ